VVEGTAAPDVETLRGSISSVRERMSDAARQAGRNVGTIRLMAVTKTLPRQVIDTAIAAGLNLFGENRVQEAEAKFLDLADRVELHLIGHLQRNKAKPAASLFRCVQSLDKLETAQALESRLAERDRHMDILLELNTSGEPTKSGFHTEADLLAALDAVASMPHLRPRGLMTVGPLTNDAARVRAAFGQLRTLFERIGGARSGFDTLSMGMSGDFELAIAEGSTLIRVGTALFGARPPVGGGAA
jgi:PLP dependent protein